MLALKLRAIGKGTGAVFPQNLLERLHVREGDTLYVVETGSGILLSPYNPDGHEVNKSTRVGIAEYCAVFEELSK